MPEKSDLRVLSGRFKGIRLDSPRSTLAHPMGSREKIALFNMLQPYLEGAKVLDIYAGSGALGIEALSRGAESVVFVEKSPQISQVIKQNVQQIAERGHLEAILGALPLESHGSAVGENRAILSENRTNLGENAIFYDIFTSSARNFAENRAWEGVFDVVLADPPYDGFNVAEVAKLPKLLRKNGILALSFPYAMGVPELGGPELLTARKYAAAGIAIYQKSGE